MGVVKICLALLLSAAFAHAAKQCKPSVDEKTGDLMRCMSLVDSKPVLISKDECSEYSHCCEKNDECYAQEQKPKGTGKLEDEDSMLKELYKQTDSVVKAANKKQEKVMSRHLRFGPFGPPGCLPPAPFPANCKFARNEPYVLEPPVDVPYCVRIPCSADNNGPLEKSHKRCGSQPGCYFDKALYEYREAFGDSVLPGVPVCQLAIRSKAFHKRAQQVVDQFGSWNPYFTNCLLNEFDEEISAGPKGCDLLPILDVFFIKPKLAGWSTIITSECALIDGCYRPGHGCFYPVDIANVVVKTGQSKIGFRKNEIIYGRPKCQHFDASSPLNILKSFHTCLASGCTVDSSITDLYYNHLFSIGESLSVKNHWEYWMGVEKGHIGAYNIDDMISEYGYNPNKGSPSPTPPKPTTENPFAMPDSSGLFPMPRSASGGGSGFQPPVFPSHSGDSRSCGYAFRQYGARPCKPLHVQLPQPNRYCPYKPFFVPRFPVLTGKFDGCCEINLCYLPKAEISEMHSGPTYYYSEWSMFSECSATCGTGQKRRYRKCISHDKSRCTEPLVQVRTCQEAPCASWSQWSRFSPCPGTCYPGGVQSRTRQCVPSNGRCDGPNEEVRTCNMHSCGFNNPPGKWTQWQPEGCTYDRFTQSCQESSSRYCTYNGVPGGKCVGSTRNTRKYRCQRCPNRG